MEEAPPCENDSNWESFDIMPEAGTDPGKTSSFQISKPSQVESPEQSDGWRARLFPYSQCQRI